MFRQQQQQQKQQQQQRDTYSRGPACVRVCVVYACVCVRARAYTSWVL